jgi:hypothetical protein
MDETPVCQAAAVCTDQEEVETWVAMSVPHWDEDELRGAVTALDLWRWDDAATVREAEAASIDEVLERLRPTFADSGSS